MKSTSYNNLHVAIIMDGNGRWATAQGLARIAGHHSGADAVRRTVEAALELGIGTLTLYAFSSDNWKRPPAEVTRLMQLFRAYLAGEVSRCIEHGIRLEIIGRRDRLDPALAATIEQTERATARARTAPTHRRGLLRPRRHPACGRTAGLPRRSDARAVRPPAR